jgi:membrane dipeptidase
MTLDRRELLGWSAMAAIAAARPSFSTWLDAAGSTRPTASAAARALYAKSVVVDGCGGPGDLSESGPPALPADTLAAIATSGVTAVNFTIGRVGPMPSAVAFEAIVRDVADWTRACEHDPGRLAIARGFDDLAAAKSAGRLALLLGLQDGVAFEDDLTRLDTLRGLGVRIIQPTYNLRNLLGDGCLEEADAGLSRAGRAAVAKMNELGILIDLSHCGKRTTADAVALSSKPVAYTHTGCFAVNPHPRNKSDEALRALADKGGVAGIYFMPYLRANGQQTAADVLEHLEHALNVAGEDHVGIGTDGGIPGIALTPEYLKQHADDVAARRKAGIGAPGENDDVFTFAPDLNSPRRLETLADLLLARGHSEARVEKLLGANFARVLKEAWV